MREGGIGIYMEREGGRFERERERERERTRTPSRTLYFTRFVV